MVTTINVCSGKGGVGKTTVAANLGIALQRLGLRTAIVDCNLTTSHLSLMFGIYNYPTTLNSYLKDQALLKDAIYTHPTGLRIVPASLRLEDLVDVETSHLKGRLKEVFADYDIVLLDSAPGLGREALIALEACDRIIFVANPYVTSLVDIVKCTRLVNTLVPRPAVMGIILNRVKGKKYEISSDEIQRFTNFPVIGKIPEDETILIASNKSKLVTLHARLSKSSKAFYKIAARFAGIRYTEPGLLERFKMMLSRGRRDDLFELGL